MSHSLSFTGVQGERLPLGYSLQDHNQGLLVSVKIPTNHEFINFKSAGNSRMNIFRVRTARIHIISYYDYYFLDYLINHLA